MGVSATRGFRPGERSFGVKEHELPVTAVTQHVLDGQQRITSLFAAAQGLVIKREDRSDDFSQLYPIVAKIFGSGVKRRAL